MGWGFMPLWIGAEAHLHPCTMHYKMSETHKWHTYPKYITPPPETTHTQQLSDNS